VLSHNSSHEQQSLAVTAERGLGIGIGPPAQCVIQRIDRPAHQLASFVVNSRERRSLNPADMLFKRDDGRGWKRAEQLRRMREVCERAGIVPGIGFHMLRHTHVSILAMQAVPMAVIARQSSAIPIPG
jgi:hypothetical protein